MTLAKILDYLLSLGSKDLFGLVTDMNTYGEYLTTATKLPAIAFSILGIVIGLFLGLLGYKLFKLVVAVVASGIGFFAGVEFFLTYIWGKFDMVPAYCCYVIAAVPAVVLFIFAVKKPVGGLFVTAALTGAIITSAYTDGKMLIIAGALLIALIAGAAPRFIFATITSFLGALIGVVNLAQVLPNVALLQIKNDNLLSLAIVGGAFVFFILIQMLITRKSNKLLA